MTCRNDNCMGYPPCGRSECNFRRPSPREASGRDVWAFRLEHLDAIASFSIARRTQYSMESDAECFRHDECLGWRNVYPATGGVHDVSMVT